MILQIAGVLIAGGGLYDLLTPKLPSNLAAICAGNIAAAKLVRELLRALGGALFAIGVTVVILISTSEHPASHFTLIIVLILVLPAESANASGMYKAGSPWQIAVGLAALATIGVLFSWSHAAH